MTNTKIQDLPSDEAQHIAQLCFGLARMEDYYVFFKEKSSIHVETQFELAYGWIWCVLELSHQRIQRKSPLRLKFLSPASWIRHTSMYEKSLGEIQKKGQAAGNFVALSEPGEYIMPVRVGGMITLDTKSNKDAPASKRPKEMGDRINRPPFMFSNTTIGSSQVAASPPLCQLTY
ncbi:hypothetical protein HAX54_000769 [Datura stramonium]|uniref:Uncharacterized protein n=1 Tax=Datura stramonium TaxID=4076 RepID=A0ABS8T1H4_DATST|nr:hypothetical protein [Datura stramonium]